LISVTVAPSLLEPGNHAVILIDHQYLQFTTMRSSDPDEVLHAVQLLAKASRLFGVPTLLTTGLASKQRLLAEVQEVFPEQEPVDRTILDAFEDERVVEWAAATGRKKLVLAGMWTESCLAMSALSAIAEGYEVYFVTDASGGGSPESHEMAVRRLVQAGAVPLTAGTYVKELQRDWARDTADEVRRISGEHSGTYGKAVEWIGQLTAVHV
jgi:nicotinamidase-related amidase